MPLETTRDLLTEATDAGMALFAFNVITLEHAEAVIEGASVAGEPVVLQISENAVRYRGGRLRPLTLAVRAMAEEAQTRASLHLDHVTSLDLLHQAAEAGYSSVMFDAAALPYDSNVRATADAAAWAHGAGLLIEAELGEVGGKQGAHAPGARTDPFEASEFVAATGVDALAVAVGSSHAMTTRDAALDSSLIEALAEAVDVPLVLHGSSGVSDVGLRRAVEAGMTKINIGTLLNIEFTSALREGLCDVEGVDPRPSLGAARTGMARAVTNLLAATSAARRSVARHVR